MQSYCFFVRNTMVFGNLIAGIDWLKKAFVQLFEVNKLNAEIMRTLVISEFAEEWHEFMNNNVKFMVIRVLKNQGWSLG